MTDKELSQLTSLCAEVADLERRREVLNLDLLGAQGDATFSFVKGSSPNFPYILHSIAVKGCADDVQSRKNAIQQEITEISINIKERTKELLAEYTRLDKWILSIDDSQLRRMFTLRYVDGYTWRQVAELISKDEGTIRDESYARHKCERFLKVSVLSD